MKGHIWEWEKGDSEAQVPEHHMSNSRHSSTRLPDELWAARIYWVFTLKGGLGLWLNLEGKEESKIPGAHVMINLFLGREKREKVDTNWKWSRNHPVPWLTSLMWGAPGWPRISSSCSIKLEGILGRTWTLLALLLGLPCISGCFSGFH